MCPPSVGASYCPKRACTAYGTCQMDHCARNAPATSRRTQNRAVPVAAAHQRTRPRTTNCKRTNHPDALGTDTNHNTHPTPRPHQQRTPTSNIRTIPGRKEHRQATFGPSSLLHTPSNQQHRQATFGPHSGKQKTPTTTRREKINEKQLWDNLPLQITPFLSLPPKGGQNVDSGQKKKQTQL